MKSNVGLDNQNEEQPKTEGKREDLHPTVDIDTLNRWGSR